MKTSDSITRCDSLESFLRVTLFYNFVISNEKLIIKNILLERTVPKYICIFIEFRKKIVLQVKSITILKATKKPIHS